jgi:membrane protease YdiL (CAAX protease family)
LKPLTHLSRLLITLGVFLIIATLAAQLANKLASVIYDTNIAALTMRLGEDISGLSITDARAFRFAQGMSSLFSFCVTALLLPLIFRIDVRQFLAWKSPDISKYLEALLILIVGIPLFSGLISWNEGLPLPFSEEMISLFQRMENISNNAYELMLQMTGPLDFWACVFVMAVIPAVGEEWLFRGVLYKIFEQWTGKRSWAIIISSLLFAVIHFQIFKFVPMLLLGTLFGMIRAWSGSVWPGVLLHFFNNFMAVLGFWLASRSDQLSFLDPDYVFPLSMQLVSASLFILLVLRYYMNRIPSTNEA